MRLFRNREDSLRFGLSFFLILGAILGSIFCNGMSVEMKKNLRVTEQTMVSAAAVVEMEKGALCFQILTRRLWTLAVLLVVSTAPAAPLLFFLAAGVIGFSTAVFICSLTMAGGLLGIWHYVLFMFPQCLFYIPVAYILLWWMPAERKHITLMSATVLAILTILGAAAESFLNPWILTLL